jgi:hypothetical protein
LKIRVRAEPHRGRTIRERCGRSHDDNRDVPAFRATPYGVEDLEPIRARQIYVEQDQPGAGEGLVRIELLHISDCCFTIFEHLEVGLDAIRTKGFPDEEYVVGIVLNDQDRRALDCRLGC